MAALFFLILLLTSISTSHGSRLSCRRRPPNSSSRLSCRRLSRLDAEHGGVAAVITEDSDLMAYGCRSVVALVCNFSAPPGSSTARLNHCEVETLFHEFGHALHSLLSRTDYQHFSGTRVAIDLAETPSNLLEYYAWDYRVLKTFAKHYLTNEVIPEKLVESMKCAKKMFAATDLQRQRGNYSKDEEELIMRMHQMVGNRWSAIAACLPGRTDNEIKKLLEVLF